MPASNSFYLQDARNNFGAVRPAPICTANQPMSQSQNIHVSTNCYYGYHDLKNPGIIHVDTDCEMVDLSAAQASQQTPSKTIAKKRCAEEQSYPQTKRLREEVQRERNFEPETNETMKLDTNTEDLTESLYWNIHGGNIYHLI